MVYFSLQIVGIYTTVFPLCIFYLTHIILFIIKLSSWHSFFLSRFKNLLDHVSHILKICSLLTHEIYFIAAGASDFVRIIMVQKLKKKKKPRNPVPWCHLCNQLFISHIFFSLPKVWPSHRDKRWKHHLDFMPFSFLHNTWKPVVTDSRVIFKLQY